ncbi:excisionase family DNA binding protein [Silvibacterium bohemicum]|uniref:Excisionase family DNA binding protein n=1 Tax=Silvibacterium bohemicum TaxID=1577686 RepID=A0A841JUB4_9BACT|nr:helix-turn-helix domain-containing protein [Silvibacterium bohemicum]MBB6144740.1 excisionase family DNA binding protein [Silvibacterium bohemicum]
MGVIEKIKSTGHMMTVDELSDLISISSKTLYAKVKAGTIPATRIAGSIRFDPALVADWLERQTVNAI